jgi:formylglycine-generating enzyme required for sulfatase activity
LENISEQEEPNMSILIAQDRIQNALNNLYYAENSIKHKLVNFVFQSYTDDIGKGENQNPKPIDSDMIIKQIWQVESPEEIAHKRKNFHTLKSSVNSDFQRLYRSGLNPDGIIIGDENIFDISNEAKDTIFAKFASGSGKDRVLNLEQLFEVLQVIENALKDPVIDDELKNNQNESFLQRLDQTLSNVMEKYASEEEEAETEEEKEEEIETESDEEEYDIIEEIVDDLEEEEEEPEEEIEDEVVEDEVVEEVEDEEEEIVEEEVEEEVEEVAEEEEEYDEEIVEDDELVEIIETGLPVEAMGFDKSDHYTDDGILKDKILLDEKLDGFLGTMERFYNQYLLINEGKYIIGSQQPERHEIFQKKVMMPEYYMGKFPVTNLLFSVFINKTGYVTTAERLGYGIVYTGRFIKKINPNTGKTSIVLNSALSCRKEPGACWHRPLGLDSDLNSKRNHPVVQVSIEDAIAFSQWIKKRIPTEIEWEVGTRTQKGYIYPWGNTWEKDRCNIESTANADTTPVDQYRQWENNYGIVDALGNVLEWTCSKKAVSNNLYYIAKGGSWISNQPPSLYQRFLYDQDYSSNIIGFRCVVSD